MSIPFKRLNPVNTSVVEKPIFEKSPRAIEIVRKSSKEPKIVSASSSLAWNLYIKKAEQLTGKLGYRHGAGKKNFHLQKTHSILAPKYLYSLFQEVNSKAQFKSYAECKSTSVDYIKMRDK